MRLPTANSISSQNRRIVAGRVVAGLVGFLIGVVWLSAPVIAQTSSMDQEALVIDDFEAYAVDTTAESWKYVSPSEEHIPPSRALEEGEVFHVKEQDGNKFLRTKTENDAIRFSRTKKRGLNWNVRKKPHLSWRWRAHHLPEGASEKDENDVGGAIYVTFDTDWLGRPKSIKYTYSSSLPAGTVVDFGTLYVIVVDSKPDSGTENWQSVQRNLLEDYDKIFGGKPPAQPLSITIWNDSDTTEDWAEVDFDDIEVSASPSGK